MLAKYSEKFKNFSRVIESFCYGECIKERIKTDIIDYYADGYYVKSKNFGKSFTVQFINKEGYSGNDVASIRFDLTDNSARLLLDKAVKRKNIEEERKRTTID